MRDKRDNAGVVTSRFHSHRTIRRFGLALGIIAIGTVLYFHRFSAVGPGQPTGYREGASRVVSGDAVLPIIPDETADRDALMKLIEWDLLPVFRDGLYRQQSSAESLTLPSDDIRHASIDGNRDMNNFLCISSNAEFRGQGRFPVTAALPNCPEDYVKGFVIARFVGSGRFVRLWITTSSLFKLQYSDEILRFYVDEGRNPIIQLPLIDAISRSKYKLFAPPFGAGGRYFMAWYYPVVFRSKLVITIDRLRLTESYYHQTDVVLDRKTKRRKAASSKLDIRQKAAKTLQAKVEVATINQTEKVQLEPGEERNVFDLKGPATIHRIRLRTDQLNTLEQIWLQVFWDGSQTSAIDLPILSLFASELSLPEKNSLVLGANRDGDTTEITLRLPMPFHTRALWKLTNRDVSTVALAMTVESAQALPKGEWGTLHVQRFETKGPTRESHHPLVEAKGRGRLVGVCLSMEGLGLDPDEETEHPLSFLEGDEIGIIDGVTAIVGTGTEDYLNSSFYFADGAFATPFAQAQKSETKTRGSVVGCRWHILSDAIDFSSSFDFSLEIGARNSTILDRYRSVAFLYQ